MTINAGVRFEDEFLPPFRSEQEGVKIANPISFGWGDKIAPRVGGAWDVRGDGKWKIASSWVRVNDVLKYELARGSFGGDYWLDHVYTLDTRTEPPVANPILARLARRSSTSTTARCRSTPGSLEGIDPDIDPMSHDAFDVSTSSGAAVMRLRCAALTSIFAGRSRTSASSMRTRARSTRPAIPATIPRRIRRQRDGCLARAEGAARLRRLRDPDRRQQPSFCLVRRRQLTLSRLYGNWAGLANSDENGRSDRTSAAHSTVPGHSTQRAQRLRPPRHRPSACVQAVRQLHPRLERGSSSVGLSQRPSGTPLSSEVTFIVPVSTTAAATWPDGHVLRRPTCC